MPGCYSKENLAVDLQTIAMRHGVPLREFEICIEDRSEDDVVSDMILSKAHAVEGDVSMLIIGAFGRKGPYVWAIGGNCEKSLLRCRVPIVTAKATSNLAAECHTWLVHSDGSDEAAAALQLALSRARPGKDRICALTIRDEWKENRGFDTRLCRSGRKIQHRGEAIAVAKDRPPRLLSSCQRLGDRLEPITSALERMMEALVPLRRTCCAGASIWSSLPHFRQRRRTDTYMTGNNTQEKIIVCIGNFGLALNLLTLHAVKNT